MFKYYAALITCLLCRPLLAQVSPLAHAHAHNDYQHARPLAEALENGFTSIEADVFLFKGELKVAHVGIGLAGRKNLQQLYLQPLKELIQKQNGQVYKGSLTPVILMIDFKGTGAESYLTLKEILKDYRDMITLYGKQGIIQHGPVQILISGSKPFNTVINEDTAYASMDGSINSNDTAYSRITTRISDPWGRFFSWRGKGAMPAAQKQRLDALVAAAHSRGKQIRFYHIPDKPRVWKTLLEAGVDWINTDKLGAFRRFCSKQYKP